MKAIEAKSFGLNSNLADIVVLFVACMAIYLANGNVIGSGDSVPNTLWGFNLLENHRIDFDIFRERLAQDPGCYYFVNSPNGHISSFYPIGPAFVSFPLCVCMWAGLKAMHVPIDITSPSFEQYRLTFEHFAASSITSLAVVFFYLSSRLKFERRTALITTCVFAFSTNTWVTCSQALWQHGSSNLMLLAAFYVLLRASLETKKCEGRKWLLLAGFCLGLMPVIRPTNLIFSFAALLYSLFCLRSEVVFLCLGTLSVVPGLVYNLIYFGTWLGAYGKIIGIGGISFACFPGSCLGTLFSPSRGLFVYSPVLVFSFVGVWRLLKKIQFLTRDELLILFLAAASLLHGFIYFFYYMWWGGHCYGPRLMTESLPMLAFVIGYFVEDNEKKKLCINGIASALFKLTFAFSCFVQIVGAFGTSDTSWNLCPLNVDQYQGRLWSMHDTQIERHCRALFQKLVGGNRQASSYSENLFGKVVSVSDEFGKVLDDHFVVFSGEHKILRMAVQNLGTAKWVGYESGLEPGQTYLEVTLVNKMTNERLPAGYLYVAGSPKTGQKCISIGDITFPSKPGDYLLLARLCWKNTHAWQLIAQPFVMNLHVLSKSLCQTGV